MADLCKPAAIHWVDGSHAEYDALCAEMVDAGTFIKLNQELWPGCYLARSDASDVARVEDRTFICSLSKEAAGPTNNWVDPFEMRKTLKRLFDGCMTGRTMYVLRVQHGADRIADVADRRAAHRLAVRRRQHADHGAHRQGGVPPHRRGLQARRAVRALGRRAARGRARQDVPWPCNKEKYIVHFPETREIWSFGSGYGGNALLGKKCFALRIASAIARDEGWMAEHMLILGVENPQGKKIYVAGGVSERVRQDELRDAHSAAALSAGRDGRSGPSATTSPGSSPTRTAACARSIPEAGFFGVAPGTEPQDQSQRDGDAREEHDLHERRADARRRRVVGRHDRRAAGAWRSTGAGKSWTPEIAKATGATAAHPNARFTAPARQCPTIDPDWENPEGVPISAIIFGGRRATTMPLVYQAFNWSSGVYIGATMGSETTAAAAGAVGKVRRDPMAMLPFCGYNMGDYFRHWINMQRQLSETPRIFHVNWFRKDKDGQVHLAGFRREHAGAEVDLRPRRAAAAARGRRRSAGCRATRTSTGPAWIFPRRDSRSCRRSTATRGATK